MYSWNNHVIPNPGLGSRDGYQPYDGKWFRPMTISGTQYPNAGAFRMTNQTAYASYNHTFPGYINLDGSTNGVSVPQAIKAHQRHSSANSCNSPTLSSSLQRFASCTNIGTPLEGLLVKYPTGNPAVEPQQHADLPNNYGLSKRKYRCKLCQAEFGTRHDLQKHVILHDEPIPKNHKCLHCSKTFTSGSYLAQHVRIHTQERPFGPCRYCGKMFIQLAHLHQHLRIHTGERPYKCHVTGCEKAFAQLSNLQNHTRHHEKTKKYKCASCFKSFDTEDQLADHIPQHERMGRTREFTCVTCDKSYTSSNYLAKHVQTRHGSQLTACSGELGEKIMADVIAKDQNGMSYQMQNNFTDKVNEGIGHIDSDLSTHHLHQTSAPESLPCRYVPSFAAP